MTVARQIATEHTYLPMVRRIAGTLRSLGVARSGGTNGERQKLTDRETQILGLVGGGLSSLQIAARLHIQKSTVETHIRSGMRKLDCAARVEAASLVATGRVSS